MSEMQDRIDMGHYIQAQTRWVELHVEYARGEIDSTDFNAEIASMLLIYDESWFSDLDDVICKAIEKYN